MAKFRLPRGNDIRPSGKWPHVALAIILGMVAMVGSATILGAVMSFIIRVISVLSLGMLLLRDPQTSISPLSRLPEKTTDSGVDGGFARWPLAPDSQQSMAVLMVSLLTPAKLRRRMIEEIEIDSHSIKRTTTLEFTIPSVLQRQPPRHDESFLIAITLRNRPNAPDELKVTDGQGAPLRVLDRDESLDCIASSISELFSAAYHENAPGDLPVDAQEVMLQAIQSISKGRTGRHSQRFDIEAVLALNPVDRTPLEIAADILNMVLGRRPIIIEVPSTETVIHARFESTSLYRIFGNDARPTSLASLAMTAGVMTGGGPTTVRIDLSNAAIAREYELWIRIPDGYYVKETSLIGTGLDELPFYEILGRNGIPYAHLHLRSGPDGRDRHSHAGTRFQLALAEIPPGQSVAATLAALIGCATVWLFARTISHSSNLGTDAPALLLAAPAAAAGWLGFDAPTRRLSNGPFAVQASLLCTFAMSIVTTSFFVLRQADVYTGPAKFFGHVTFLGVAEPTWAVLVAISVLNLIGIASYAMRETRDYLKHFRGNPWADF